MRTPRHKWATCFLLITLLSCKKDQTAEKLTQERLNLLTAEALYLERLDRMVSARPHLETASQLSVFISGKTIGALLSVLKDASGPIPGIANARFRVVSFDSDFRDGFPLLKLKGEAERSDMGVKAEVAIDAVVQPIVTPDQPNSLLLRLQVVDVLPVVQWGALEAKLGGFVKDLLQAKLAGYAASLPEIRIPLRSDFSIDLPASEQPVSFPVPNGTVSGIISVPGLKATKSVFVDKAVFLSDGLHVMLSVDRPTAEVPIEFPLQTQTDLTGRELQNQTSAKQALIDEKRKSLGPKIGELKVSDAALRVWISQTMFSTLVANFNALPAASRHLHYRTTGTTGQLVSTGGGAPFSCGYYAEINGGNSADADLDLTSLRSRWTPDGTVLIEADYSAQFRAQIAGHGNAPAAYCIVKNFLGIPGPDFAQGLQCRCGLGGGIGTSVGAHGGTSPRR